MMMMMIMIMMTLITCQMTSSRGGIPPPFPTNKGAPKISLAMQYNLKSMKTIQTNNLQFIIYNNFIGYVYG